MDFVCKLYGNTYAVHVTVALVGVATLNLSLPAPLVFKIAKFEFKAIAHYGLWAKCTQLWPLKYVASGDSLFFSIFLGLRFLALDELMEEWGTSVKNILIISGIFVQFFLYLCIRNLSSDIKKMLNLRKSCVIDEWTIIKPLFW